MLNFLFYIACIVIVGAILRAADITGWVALPIILLFAVILAFGFWPKLYHREGSE